jgi:hypothetical protein
MEERINVAEILRNCQSGMELDCTIFGTKVIYQKIYKTAPYPIVVQTEHGFEFRLTQYGQIHNIVGAECVIFPKGKTTWKGFQRPFKDGDIISNGQYVAIFYKTGTPCYCISPDVVYYHCYYNQIHRIFKEKLDYGIGCSTEFKYATEEEKKILFDVIKANGYKWNEETKTLEELVKPKFKVGDKVIKKGGITIPVLITNVGEEFYSSNTEHSVVVFSIKEQDHYELVPNKFDINTLKPFDTVLVKSDNSAIWECDFFSSYNPNCSNKFHCIGAWYNICIPYKNNEHLLGTTNDCSEYYKTWE